jgi:glycosyltransferase involved in cell wall biosynthesis
LTGVPRSIGAESAPWPAVTAVIATRDRPELLAKAITAVVDQDYPGDIEVVVVFDQAPVREEITTVTPGRADRRVRATANTRAPGLAGARNTGILAASSELVAFCDDDDWWVPTKLSRQVAELTATGAVMAVGGIRVHYGPDRAVLRERCPPAGVVDLDELWRSRLTGAHPSTFLLRREELVGRLGLVDEAIPYGYGEDYDLLLRAARAGRVVVLDGVLAEVLWHPGSYFSRRWDAMVDGLGYLLVKHPEIASDAKGFAWIQGQRAFALAASGRRVEAIRTAWVSLRSNPRELRGPLALLVAARLISAERVMSALNARGRGI